MTCAEFQAEVELFAAGALEPAQLESLRRHLAEEGPHQGCLEALRRADEAWALLGRSLSPARADERLWRRIEARISPRPRISAVPAWAGWWAAAAALLLLILVTGMRARQVREAADAAQRAEADRQACARELEALRSESQAQRDALALLTAPDTKVLQLAPPQPGSSLAVRALVNLPQRKGIVYGAALPRRPGKDYELWVIRGDRKLPAGLLRAAAGGELVASIDPQLLAAPPDALAVTLEPEGGSEQPRGDVVLLAVFPRT